MRWGRRGVWHRVRVERRQHAGMAASFDIAMSGRRWQYWCTCDVDPRPFPTQPMALAAGLSHLATIHGEVGRAR